MAKPVNYITVYNRQIKTGKIVAGQWVKLIYEYLAKGLRKRSFYYDAEKTQLAIDFIEKFCRHSEGRSDHLTLELWQKACVAAIFGIVDKKGLRVFREVFLVVTVRLNLPEHSFP